MELENVKRNWSSFPGGRLCQDPALFGARSGQTEATRARSGQTEATRLSRPGANHG
jgi:hypothetical protein